MRQAIKLSEDKEKIKMEDVKLVTDLIHLVLKYANKACSCEPMVGYQCPTHSEVREDIEELKSKYGLQV